MADDRLRSANLILARFGAVCAGAGILIGALLGWWFGSSLTSFLASRGLARPVEVRREIWVEQRDPLLHISWVNKNIDALKAHDQLFPQAHWTAFKVEGNRAFQDKPDGMNVGALLDGSCIVAVDGALPRTGQYGYFKIIYRTDRGWDQGYIKLDSVKEIPLRADCQAQVYEAQKR